jgi:[acyl-carrier-protein] S-malonyltransferase
MTAILGGQEAEVLAAIKAAGAEVANINGAGQIVAAGGITALAELAANLPDRTRARQLAVAGAFHSPAMEPAFAAVEAAVANLEATPPRYRLLSNRDGQVVTDPTDWLRRLVSQVTREVRWDLCQESCRQLGVSGLLELTPAGTLTGLARRQLAGVELFNLNHPDQLDQARAFCRQHAER